MSAARPQIDYTDKDFASLRKSLLQFARLRLPEWTDRNPADLGMLMVDMFAYMGDLVLYYQDRIANEAFLETASEPRSVIEHLRLIGYELAPPKPAAAELDLTFDPGLPFVVIPRGAQFRATSQSTPVVFEYLEPDLTITLGSDQVETLPDGQLLYRGLPVRQGITVPPTVLGSSSGEPNQSFAVLPGPIVPSSINLEVEEGAGWVRWDRRDSLLYDTGPDGRVRLSDPQARHYYLRFGPASEAFVHFGGDGRFGRRPTQGPNNIRASWRTTAGAVGNVPAGTITESLTPIAGLDLVSNPAAAAGGTDAESIEDAARFGPLAFRARNRAVARDDYSAMAHLAGGVAKARARTRSWNRIDLYVAPTGPELAPVPESLRRQILAFFEDRRMAGTFVRIHDATGVDIDLTLEITFDERYRADAVRQAVESAVAEVLAFDTVDFGETVYLGMINDAAIRAAGVRSVRILRFKRRDQTDGDIAAALAASNLPAIEDLPEILRDALDRQVEADGQIDLAFNEIPRLGALDITTAVAAS